MGRVTVNWKSASRIGPCETRRPVEGYTVQRKPIVMLFAALGVCLSATVAVAATLADAPAKGVDVESISFGMRVFFGMLIATAVMTFAVAGIFFSLAFQLWNLRRLYRKLERRLNEYTGETPEPEEGQPGFIPRELSDT